MAGTSRSLSPPLPLLLLLLLLSSSYPRTSQADDAQPGGGGAAAIGATMLALDEGAGEPLFTTTMLNVDGGGGAPDGGGGGGGGGGDGGVGPVAITTTSLNVDGGGDEGVGDPIPVLFSGTPPDSGDGEPIPELISMPPPDSDGEGGEAAETTVFPIELPNGPIEMRRDGTVPNCTNSGRTFKARRVVPGSSGSGEGYRMTYELGPGRVVEVYSSPLDDELSVAAIGIGGDVYITDNDRTFLLNMASELEDVDGMDVDLDHVNSLDTQAPRATRMLSEWPGNLPIGFSCPYSEEFVDCPPDATTFQRPHPAFGHLDINHDHFFGGGDRRRGRRRLFHDADSDSTVQPLCFALDSLFDVTHDDDTYERWDNRTTYWAYLDMTPPCTNDTDVTSDGTWFFNYDSELWECYEPDHPPDAEVDYAWGNCFGRCGRGCSGSESSTMFTVDCADHDSCQRFGHGKWSEHCHDEFLRTVDDRMWAPNCVPVGPNPECYPPQEAPDDYFIDMDEEGGRRLGRGLGRGLRMRKFVGAREGSK